MQAHLLILLCFTFPQCSFANPADSLMRANALCVLKRKTSDMQAHQTSFFCVRALLIDIHIIPLSKMFCNDFAITDL